HQACDGYPQRERDGDRLCLAGDRTAPRREWCTEARSPVAIAEPPDLEFGDGKQIKELTAPLDQKVWRSFDRQAAEGQRACTGVERQGALLRPAEGQGERAVVEIRSDALPWIKQIERMTPVLREQERVGVNHRRCVPRPVRSILRPFE